MKVFETNKRHATQLGGGGSDSGSKWQHFLKVFWFYLGGVGEGAGVSTVLFLRGDNLATIVFAFNDFSLVGAGLRLCENH